MNIGDILKSLRNERGLKQDDIAEMLNIKRQTYSSWERDNSIPDINTIAYLSNFYEVSTDYILGLTKIKSRVDKIEDSVIKNQTLGLSQESKKELENYIRLLKIKDIIDEGKEEQSSALEKLG